MNTGSNPAFVGVMVNPDAPPLPGAHPPGYFARIQWQLAESVSIAAAMAAEGYIVAAPDHPARLRLIRILQRLKAVATSTRYFPVIDFVIDSPALSGQRTRSVLRL